MNILVLGSGGREHSISWKLAQSSKMDKLYIVPGNAGTHELGENVEISVNDFEGIKEFIKKNQINMLIVGPEEPLVKGITDFLRHDPQLKKLIIIGPDKKGALLEGSKDFAKSFMQKYGIPTAQYKSFDASSVDEAYEFLNTLNPPYVLKADGLAGGKGVVILENIKKARAELAQMFEGKFGEAGKKVVIEEFLNGIELSVFVLTDGKNYKLLPEAKDYKQIGEGNTGLNTGGMGSVSPVPFVDDAFMNEVEHEIIQPTIQGLMNEGINYQGFIFFGLMKVEDKPLVVEYNVRMGDPEAEAVIPRIETDLVSLFEKLPNQQLDEMELEINPRAVGSVMMVSGGYPEKYEKGKVITGLNSYNPDTLIFHAGTKTMEDQVITSGGRVLAITSYGDDIFNALNHSYETIRHITFENAYYRKDIGFDLKA